MKLIKDQLVQDIQNEIKQLDKKIFGWSCRGESKSNLEVAKSNLYIALSNLIKE